MQFLVREDFTHHEVTKPESLQVTAMSPWATTPEACKPQGPHSATEDATSTRSLCTATTSVQQGRPRTAENKQVKVLEKESKTS